MRYLHRRHPEGPEPVTPWSAPRLLVLFGGLLAVVMALVAGLGYLIYTSLTGPNPTAAVTASRPSIAQMDSGRALGMEQRNAIAAAPMQAVDPNAMFPSAPAVTPGRALIVPTSTQTGADDITTGFPHTPAGSLAQLAAILHQVLTQMSLPDTAQIYDDWALPGGVGEQAWDATAAVASFLTSVKGTSVLPVGVSVGAVPAAGIIKGTDGPDWTLACVLIQFTATANQTASVGLAFCDRMQWVPDPHIPAAGGRWEIAPGAAPAPAPSVWPGTTLAQQVGWLAWSPMMGVGS